MIQNRLQTITLGLILTVVVFMVFFGVGYFYIEQMISNLERNVFKESKGHYVIKENDSGKTFSYPKGSYFTIVLDEDRYPKKELKCAPNGIVRQIGNEPKVKIEMYAIRFETENPGTCMLKSGSFAVAIRVENKDSVAKNLVFSGIRGTATITTE